MVGAAACYTAVWDRGQRTDAAGRLRKLLPAVSLRAFAYGVGFTVNDVLTVSLHFVLG